jgi:GTP-binding protein
MGPVLFVKTVIYVFMKNRPVVAIVGRTNVGKSTLCNRICGRRDAVVDDAAGITRDRKYMAADWNGCRFWLVDTGGFYPGVQESLFSEVEKQIHIAIAQAHVVVLITDVTTGVTDIDETIARMLHRGAPDRVMVTVNKVDRDERLYDAAEFYTLGFGEPYPVSALHGRGVGDVLDTIVHMLGKTYAGRKEGEADETIRTAIVGRPNAGKSSLVNALLNEPRCIVHDMPGTTRDAIDTPMRYMNRTLMLVDTAGLRKKARVKTQVEYYANTRTLGSIERSDVCVVMVDSLQGLVNQDLSICTTVMEQKKAMVLCWNKWDAVSKDARLFDMLVKNARLRYPLLSHVPMLSISALQGMRVRKVLDHVIQVATNMRRRVPATHLSQQVEEWVHAHPHPSVENCEVRILGVRQETKAWHPIFYFFVTYPHLVSATYIRYLKKKLYATYDFAGCPITIQCRQASPGKDRRGAE